MKQRTRFLRTSRKQLVAMLWTSSLLFMGLAIVSATAVNPAPLGAIILYFVCLGVVWLTQ